MQFSNLPKNILLLIFQQFHLHKIRLNVIYDDFETLKFARKKIISECYGIQRCLNQRKVFLIFKSISLKSQVDRVFVEKFIPKNCFHLEIRCPRNTSSRYMPNLIVGGVQGAVVPTRKSSFDKLSRISKVHMQYFVGFFHGIESVDRIKVLPSQYSQFSNFVPRLRKVGIILQSFGMDEIKLVSDICKKGETLKVLKLYSLEEKQQKELDNKLEIFSAVILPKSLEHLKIKHTCPSLCRIFDGNNNIKKMVIKSSRIVSTGDIKFLERCLHLESIYFKNAQFDANPFVLLKKKSLRIFSTVRCGYHPNSVVQFLQEIITDSFSPNLRSFVMSDGTCYERLLEFPLKFYINLAKSEKLENVSIQGNQGRINGGYKPYGVFFNQREMEVGIKNKNGEYICGYFIHLQKLKEKLENGEYKVLLMKDMCEKTGGKLFRPAPFAYVGRAKPNWKWITLGGKKKE